MVLVGEVITLLFQLSLAVSSNPLLLGSLLQTSLNLQKLSVLPLKQALLMGFIQACSCLSSPPSFLLVLDQLGSQLLTSCSALCSQLPLLLFITLAASFNPGSFLPALHFLLKLGFGNCSGFPGSCITCFPYPGGQPGLIITLKLTLIILATLELQINGTF